MIRVLLLLLLVGLGDLGLAILVGWFLGSNDEPQVRA